MIIGNDINIIINKLSERELLNLYNNKSHDKQFKYIAEGYQGIVYKLGNYAIKICEIDKHTKEEYPIIKILTEHNDLKNFIKFYHVRKTDKFVVYVMQYVQYTLKKLFDNKNITDNEWLNIMFQLLVSMYNMINDLKLYHNDLKFDNVMFDEVISPIKLIFNVNHVNYEITTKYIIYVIDFGQSSFDKNKGRLINDIEFISTIYKKFILEVLLHEKDFLKYIKQTNELVKYMNDLKNKPKFAKQKKDFIDYIVKKLTTAYAIDNNLLNIKSCEEKYKDLPYKNIISYDLLHFFGTFDKNNLLDSIKRTFDKIKN